MPRLNLAGKTQHIFWPDSAASDGKLPNQICTNAVQTLKLGPGREHFWIQSQRGGTICHLQDSAHTVLRLYFSSSLKQTMLFFIWMTVFFPALLLMVLAVAQQKENRRFVKKRRLQTPPPMESCPGLSLVIPVCGNEHQLRDNLYSWFEQDYHNREIIFVAESAADPAVPQIRSLIAEERFVRALLVFSGPATGCGQATHQLLTGLRHVSRNTEILAFARADSKARSTALRWMAAGLQDRNVGAVTGLLWSIPRHQTLLNRLHTSLNNSLAALNGAGTNNPLCTASWAIRREDFERLGLGQVWSQVLCEQWPSWQAIRQAGMQIRCEPHCSVESTIETTSRRLFDSAIRKSMTARTYSPMTWWIVFAGLATIHLAFWTGLAITIFNLAPSLIAGLLCGAGTAVIYLMGIARSVIRNQTAKISFPVWKLYRSARRFDTQMWPLISLVGLAMQVRSLMASRIQWRSRRYKMAGNGLVRFDGVVPFENIMRQRTGRIPAPGPSLQIFPSPESDENRKVA